VAAAGAQALVLRGQVLVAGARSRHRGFSERAAAAIWSRLPISDSQREVLERLSRSRTAAHRDVQRARVLLMAGAGEANTRIAARGGVGDA
jgi:hypothetical protein